MPGPKQGGSQRCDIGASGNGDLSGDRELGTSAIWGLPRTLLAWMRKRPFGREQGPGLVKLACADEVTNGARTFGDVG